MIGTTQKYLNFILLSLHSNKHAYCSQQLRALSLMGSNCPIECVMFVDKIEFLQHQENMRFFPRSVHYPVPRLQGRHFKRIEFCRCSHAFQ